MVRKGPPPPSSVDVLDLLGGKTKKASQRLSEQKVSDELSSHLHLHRATCVLWKLKLLSSLFLFLQGNAGCL